MKHPGFGERLGIFVRSLSVMGSWNFPRMQGLGFFYIIAPFIQRHSPERKAALRRQFAYFNTHPYMASYILGAVAALEARGEGENAVKVRNSLMGPLGAAGDGLFWASLKPLAVVIGLVIALFSPLAGVIALLVLYNLVHIWARWSLFRLGFENSEDPLAAITRLDTRGYTNKANQGLVAASGFLLGLMGLRSGSPGTALMMFLTSLLLYRCTRNWLITGIAMMIIAVVLARLGMRIPIPWQV
jgi:PTS system mannose-specific IID component